MTSLAVTPRTFESDLQRYETIVRYYERYPEAANSQGNQDYIRKLYEELRRINRQRQEMSQANEALTPKITELLRRIDEFYFYTPKETCEDLK